MNSDTGGQFSNSFGRNTPGDAQRRAAVDLARRKVLAAYVSGPQTIPEKLSTAVILPLHQ